MLPFGDSKSGIPHHATSARRSTGSSINPQRVLLSSRTQIDRFDGGLAGIAGTWHITVALETAGAHPYLTCRRPGDHP